MSKNVSIKVNGTKAIIELDLAQNFGASKSGKTDIIASTEGNITIPGTDIKLGLNAYKSKA